MQVVTISQRQARETARRVEAARAVIGRLRDFVEASGRRGRFVVFGSVASGAMRFTSDFDVLLDFPPDLEAAAWRAAEDACRAWDIPPDIHSTTTEPERFVAKIMARPVEIIG